ncbi:uncharacterized protein LOC128204488 [Mya arenaria]|uniref:uncharacterized protein LOC128204488 n=1 Tax=Mya arenaria TaxID=6604 RepID=UPI0022E3EA24|nr:uncharacterized protein LOC128204488 [Mya arenaria]
MEVTKLLGIIILHVALLISHECSPCFCCKQDIVADNDDSNGAVMAGVTGGVIALLSVSLALSVGYIVYMKRRQTREHPEKQSATADEEARTYEQLQERTEQPNYQNVKDSGTDNYAVLFADTNM